MKAFSRFFLFFCILRSLLFGEGAPHFLLNFDVNKTLIASDRLANKSIEDVLNELLADKYSYQWEESLDKPITFRSYVLDVLFPGSRDNNRMKATTMEQIVKFLSYLEERNHPLHPIVLKDYEKALNILNHSPSIIFPSFYRLLQTLDEADISYSIILRSFGEEVFDLVDELNRLHKEAAYRKGHFKKGVLYFEDGQVCEKPEEIYAQLVSSGNLAIRDDWKYWDAHGMAKDKGKPFYIDTKNEEMISLFFDDNVRKSHPTINIVSPVDVYTGRSMPVEPLIEAGLVIRVDTLEAIIDEEYFIHFIKSLL